MLELNKKTLKKIFLVVGACIVLYWLLHETDRVKTIFGVIKGIFAPFVMGASFAFVLNVPMRAIEKWLKAIKHDKFRRILAILLTFIAVLVVVSIVCVLLTLAIIDAFEALGPKLSNYEFLDKFVVQLQPLLSIDLEQIDFRNFDVDMVFSLARQVIDMLGSSMATVLSGAFSAVGNIAVAIVNVVIAVVFALYCLVQKETLARQGRKLLYAYLPEKTSDEIVRILRLTNSTFSNFLSGQCIEVCILGAMFAVAMSIFGMDHVALISVLIAVTAFIPIVGAFAGCIVGAFLLFLSNPYDAIIFVAMFLIIQQIEGNLIYPKVVGESIGLPGMWVLLAVAIGGGLFGVAGMFLMIPLSSVIYTLIREVTNKRLNNMTIDPEKLKDQPPDLRSHFKEKQQKKKEKRMLRRFERKSNKK